MKNEQKNEERRRLGFTRVEYQAFQRDYRELRERSDQQIDEGSKLRFRQMYIQAMAGKMDDLNEHELAEIRKRKDLTEWCLKKDDDILQGFL